MVVIKAIPVPEPTKEVEIALFLNSPELRGSKENHAIPVIDHFVSEEGWQFIVMPAWRFTFTTSLVMWQLDDYFEIIIQSLQVYILVLYGVFGFLTRKFRDWHLCINMA